MEPASAVFPDLDLVIRPPYPPMEALAVDALPPGAEWLFEPNWDGFRCLAFRDGARVAMQSKSAQPLTRYFPELVEALLALLPARFVLNHYSGRRFRHGTKFLRWRPHEAPRLCTFAQLEGGRDESLAAFWGRRAG
jgi:hypothetical protein